MADTLTREEWMRRYAARVMECAGVEEHQAIEIAKVGAECWAEGERAASTAIEWIDPEDAADEEMSYWENDE